MTTESPEFKALEQRLKRLERQNRRIIIFGCAVTLMLMSSLMAAYLFYYQRQTIRAERFVLQDTNGTEVASLGYWNDSPRLIFGTEGTGVEVELWKNGIDFHETEYGCRASLQRSEESSGLWLSTPNTNVNLWADGHLNNTSLEMNVIYGETLVTREDHTIVLDMEQWSRWRNGELLWGLAER